MGASEANHVDTAGVTKKPAANTKAKRIHSVGSNYKSVASK